MIVLNFAVSSFVVFSVIKTKISSAYRQTLTAKRLTSGSIMYMTKKRGPSTEPYGTPTFGTYDFAT